MNLCWVTIRVSDLDESLRFYRDLLGLEVARRLDPAPGTEIVFLGPPGGTEVELIRTGDGAPRYGEDFSIGFEVGSLAGALERLRAGGVTECSGPFQPTPALRFVFVRDPDGLRVQLVERTGA